MGPKEGEREERRQSVLARDWEGKERCDDADVRPKVVMSRKRVSSKKGTFALLVVGGDWSGRGQAEGEIWAAGRGSAVACYSACSQYGVGT